MCVHSPGRIVVILFEFNQNDSRFLANRTDGTRVRAFDKRSAGTRVEQTHGRDVSGVLQGHGGVHKRACGEAPCKEQSGLKALLTDACGRKGRAMLTQTRDGNKFVEFAFALSIVHRPAAPFVPEGAKYGHGLRTPIQLAHTPCAHWWVNLVASSSTYSQECRTSKSSSAARHKTRHRRCRAGQQYPGARNNGALSATHREIIQVGHVLELAVRYFQALPAWRFQ